jgi:selenide,water dikinase
VLRRLPFTDDPNLLVGAATGDDAGVYRLRADLALVQTVDFFTPIVDDPFAYGQIAAANSLSDVYAMGGRPITAMNVMGVPTDLVQPEVIARILNGGAAKVKEAGCALVGGHTIKNPEPIYGLSVTGTVHPKRVMTNAAARPGDLLILTKPLGTGIATTGIKRGLASKQLEKKVIRQMARLNTAGTEVAERGLVKAATDVTGFGLLGHLDSMCRASGVDADIDVAAVPVISDEILALVAAGCVPGGSSSNLKTAEKSTDWGETDSTFQSILTDAQTSGGLLLCVPPKNLVKVLQVLKRHRTPCAVVIGRITRRNGTGRRAVTRSR